MGAGPQPRWIPFRLRRESSEIVVDWCEWVPSADGHPMFDASIHERIRGGALCRTTSVAALEAYRGFAPAGFIYHVSRCGSTLLSNMLGAVDGAMSISEPMIVSAATRDAHLRESIAADTVSALVAACAPKRVIMKLTADAINHSMKLSAAFPDVPRIFLYRDPIEVVVSLVGGHAETLPPAIAEAGLLPHSSTLTTMKPPEFWARVVGRQMIAAMEAYRSADDGALLLNYSELPNATVERAAPFLGLRLSQEDNERMQAVATRSAKARHKEFVRDAESKQRQATHAIREAVRQFACEPYLELESLRRKAVASMRSADYAAGRR